MILDCTLRDGGYYTNWDFSEDLVDIYIESTNNLPIDYLEIGYRNKPKADYYGEFFYCPEYILNKFSKSSNKKIAIMLNEKDCNLNDIDYLLKPCLNKVNMVRIACDPKRINECILLAKTIKETYPEFEIAFNIMYMSEWKNYPNLSDDLSIAIKYVDYIYMVDSYGGIIPSDINDSIKIILNSFNEEHNCYIGFHGHNNLELALANSLKAHQVVDIIDSTFTGMGRGAGNLKTELLLTYFESEYKNFNVDFNYLSNIVESMMKLQEKFKWGTELPYMVSGANSLPQKDVMSWVSERTYSMNSIVRGLLDNNNENIKNFDNSSFITKSSIIIGGGESIKKNIKVIKRFINNNPNLILIFTSTKFAKLFTNIKNKKIYCLIGNEGIRLEKDFGDDISKYNNSICVLPSTRKMGTYIPNVFKNKVFQISTENDSLTNMSLNLMDLLYTSERYIIGYDGYLNPNKKEQKLFSENEIIFNTYINENEDDNLYSLLPTLYKLKSKSIFSLLC